jgi:hypothetical protein
MVVLRRKSLHVRTHNLNTVLSYFPRGERCFLPLFFVIILTNHWHAFWPYLKSQNIFLLTLMQKRFPAVIND